MKTTNVIARLASTVSSLPSTHSNGVMRRRVVDSETTSRDDTAQQLQLRPSEKSSQPRPMSHRQMVHARALNGQLSLMRFEHWFNRERNWEAIGRSGPPRPFAWKPNSPPSSSEMAIFERVEKETT